MTGTMPTRALVLCLALAAGAATAAPLPVIVSVLPHADLVARLAGDLVTVHVLAGPGQSPHTYDPTPRELAALTDARLWLRTGMAMENALAGKLARVAPDLTVVDLRQGLDLLHEADHHHAEGESCGDEGLDAHIWLSARLASAQAATAAAALAAADPTHADRYRANLVVLQDSLAAVDRDLTTLLAPLHGRAFYVFHPAFGYFARDYGLRQVAIEAGGIDPSPRHLAAVMSSIKREGARTIFLQPQYAGGAAKALAAEADLRAVELDPYPADLLAALRDIGATLRRELGDDAP